jgi:DNA-binding GntR family transcriptional regulator
VKENAVSPGPADGTLVARLEQDDSLPSSDRVYRGLRKYILNGTLAPSTRLVELQLASQFDVSRTPVREALKRLAAEGLVALDPVRGMVVREINPAEAEDIYVIREVLDGLGARLAAGRISAGSLAKLHVLTELMQEAADDHRWEAVVQMNISFHEVLYSAANNERLSLIARSLEETVRRFSTMAFSHPERVAQVIHEHQEIIRALEEGDPDRAEAVTRQHMVHARSHMSGLSEAGNIHPSK